MEGGLIRVLKFRMFLSSSSFSSSSSSSSSSQVPQSPTQSSFCPPLPLKHPFLTSAAPILPLSALLSACFSPTRSLSPLSHCLRVPLSLSLSLSFTSLISSASMSPRVLCSFRLAASLWTFPHTPLIGRGFQAGVLLSAV